MTTPFADEQLAAFVAQSSAAFGDLDVPTLRRMSSERAQQRPRGPEMAEVRDLDAAGCAARLYRPRAALDQPQAAPDRPAEAEPLVLYLHGGGWSIGGLDTHDRMCRRLAARSGVTVLALAYRLAPEHPWPAAVDDVVDALHWLAAGQAALAGEPGVMGMSGDIAGAPSAVAVAGDSAGGTLAALACLRLRDEDPRALPALQVLLYANTDLTGAHPSMREKAHGWGLEAETVRFFNRQWMPDESHWSDPRVSPLHAPDLSGLPSALIVSAEHDPLRDESEAYGRRLHEAGVVVEVRREPGLIHNFMLLDEISPACAAAADRVADDLRARLAKADGGLGRS